MNYKKTCEKLLSDLKKMGFPRKKIEEELGYHPAYLDQAMSRGSNKTVYAKLTEYKAEKDRLNVITATKNELILSMRASIMYLTNRVFELESRNSGRSIEEIREEADKMMKLLTLELASEKEKSSPLKR